MEAEQGVEDDPMNVLCMGDGPWDRKWLGIWSRLTWRQSTAAKNGICAAWGR